MKNLLIPAIIMTMGVGAAFATSTAKNRPLVLQDGYRIDGSGNCVVTPQQCNTIPTTTCTWQGDVLHEKISDNPTVCGDQLFMP